MIKVSELRKKHGERTILDGISFEVDKGETVAVVGPSGGGKTTLLRCMHGLASFDGGTVEIAGTKLGPGAMEKQPEQLAGVRRKAGFVFQTWHLFAHMTVLENVIEAPIHVKRVPKKQAIAKAEELLEKVGMSHRKSARPKALSGGEQQRAAIARALAMEPEVLFMDEPTSALDPQRIGDLVDLLAKLNEEGLTLAAVTHEISFAQRLATRALVLIEGKLVEQGHPASVLVEPNDPRVRAFLGLD
jgi:ABC-type polar amino acid transport system ATPase subunit